MKLRSMDIAAAFGSAKIPRSMVTAANIDVHATAWKLAAVRRVNEPRVTVRVAHPVKTMSLHSWFSTFPFHRYQKKLRTPSIATVPSTTDIAKHHPSLLIVLCPTFLRLSPEIVGIPYDYVALFGERRGNCVLDKLTLDGVTVGLWDRSNEFRVAERFRNLLPGSP